MARNKILFSSDSWAHGDSIAPYGIIFRHYNFSAILNFPKKLLFRTPPRPSLQFPRKLNQIIFRPCRQKVMEFVLIRRTVLEYRANKFYVALAEIDTSQYLLNTLSYSDQTWYMSSQAWPEATCCVSAQRHLWSDLHETLHASSPCSDTYAHQFWWSSEFSFGIYRLLSVFCHAPFLNDPVTATQMPKFNFFLIIIDLESPENCPRLVWFRSGEKPGTSSQK